MMLAMSSTGLEPDVCPPPPSETELAEAMDAHVLRVSQSSIFLRAETLKKLLLYLWAHRGDEISEYGVAVDALGRRPDFDPKLDASVRVQIARLRRKLDDFYRTEGTDDVFVLHIPVGTHALDIENRSAGEPPGQHSEPESVAEPESQGPWTSHLIQGLITVCILLISVTTLLAWNIYTLKTQRTRSLVIPSSFWVHFVGSGTPVKIILPTPVFFIYSNDDKLHLRDVDINEFDQWKTSRGVSELAHEYGQPRLDQSYTVTSDTLAGIELARYLDRVGLGEIVGFGVSSDATMNLLENSNVIAFGAHATLSPFQGYLNSMNFSLEINEDRIVNKEPAKGELETYERSEQGFGRSIEPSIVAVLPSRNPGKKLLILQSRYTSALVEMMTSQVGNNLFTKMYEAHGSPPYFEMVVMNEIEGTKPIKSTPLAMHAYIKDPPNGVGVTQ